MPTPLEILLDPISLTVLAIYGALILLEAVFPARPLPHVPWWRTRALAVFTLYFFLSSYLPLLWTETLAQYQLVSLEGLNPFFGAAIGARVEGIGRFPAIAGATDAALILQFVAFTAGQRQQAFDEIVLPGAIHGVLQAIVGFAPGGLPPTGRGFSL